MTLNWNHNLVHSNEPIWRGLWRVDEEVGVDQRVFSHLCTGDTLKIITHYYFFCLEFAVFTQCLVPQSIRPTTILYSSPEDAVALQ